MGGIGITITSKDEPNAPSKPIAHLPQQVVDAIASKLNISQDAKQSLMQGQLEPPDNVEVTITRLSNNTSVQLKKVAEGGSAGGPTSTAGGPTSTAGEPTSYDLTYQNVTTRITL